MHLKSLEVNGFKSFAKKTTLEFLSPIVAIVGPNGSGKSNVAEAFRFVLGEQSMKSLRGKRGEDLIFNGSKTLPKMNRGSVKLIFDNRTRLFPLEMDEIVLERVVHRDSVNEYLMNGSQVRLKDIIELLSSANIGASGHHIISQGEADRLLNASPKERKEMIEEALGLKLYQYKREESERKLEKTSENIAQVQALRREIAPHIAFLSRQAEKIQKAEKMRDEFREKAKEYLKREEEYLANERSSLEIEKQGPLHEMKMLETRVASLQHALSSSEDEGLRKEMLQTESALREARKQEEHVRFDISRLEGELTAEKKALERAHMSGVPRESLPFGEVENFSREFDARLRDAEGETDSGKLLSLFRNLYQKLVEILEKRIGRGGGEEELLKEVAVLEERQKHLETELNERSNETRVYEGEFRALEERARKTSEHLRESEREIFTLLSRKNELGVLLSQLRGREEALERDEERYKEELRECQALGGLEVLRFNPLDASSAHEEERRHQEDRRKALERIKIRLEEAGGGESEETLKEFHEAKERDAYLAKEVSDLEQSAATLKELIQSLIEKLRSEFGDGLSKINTEFGNFFSLMFGGGGASLSLQKIERRRRILDEDEDDSDHSFVPEEEKPEEGLEISVSLPHKRIKGLEMLSGGERALTSIALLFAISQVNPPPFVILDETDAALDEANSRKYGDMIEALAKHSQLILITHNRETMSRAGVLYGVTMGMEGVSKLLSVKFDEAVAVAK